MFERFTDRARRAVTLANQEAHTLGHNYIGTEHILLGLIEEGDGVAFRVLNHLDVTLSAVRVLVDAEVGPQDGVRAGRTPFNPDARKALELALREALKLRHNYIGTEHVLLGLMRQGTPSEMQNESTAVKVLRQLGVTHDAVRQKVMRLLDGEEQPAATTNGKHVLIENPPDKPRPKPELVRRTVNAIVRATDAQLEEVLRMLEGE